MATVPAPCGGSPTQYQTTIGGKQLCLGIVPGQYYLQALPCSSSFDSTQLWAGAGSSSGMTVAQNGWCVTAGGFQDTTDGEWLVQYPCSASPGGPEVYILNADGQLVSGSTNLCLQVITSNNGYIQLDTCDPTNPAQAWQPVCPPAPPPPVAFVEAPCGGGAAMLAQTVAGGQQACLTGGESTGYNVAALQCVWGANQLLTGFGSGNGLAFSSNDWCAAACMLSV